MILSQIRLKHDAKTTELPKKPLLRSVKIMYQLANLNGSLSCYNITGNLSFINLTKKSQVKKKMIKLSFVLVSIPWCAAMTAYFGPFVDLKKM